MSKQKKTKHRCQTKTKIRINRCQYKTKNKRAGE